MRNPTKRTQATRRRTRGMVLIAVSVAMLFLLAGIGFGVDANRILTAQRRIQAAAESAALAAALELDGTAAGLERSRARARLMTSGQFAATGANTPEVHIEYATADRAAWDEDPAFAAGLAAARVTVSGATRLTLLRTFVGRSNAPAHARVAAAQVAREPAPGDLFPGVTVATAAEALVPGQQYRLDGGGPQCDGTPADPPLSGALAALVRADSDPAAAGYARYAGNGRRLIAAAVTDPSQPDRPPASGAFLVLAGPLPACGEYVGGFLESSRRRAVAARGYWAVEVVR